MVPLTGSQCLALDRLGGRDLEAIALAFGATVHALRLQAGLSLNELARRAGVDPAYVHRIEARAARSARRCHAGRSSGARRGTRLGPTPGRPAARAGRPRARALLELGGWDQTLASVAELLADPSLSGPAKAEFREIVRILARRWARAEPLSGARDSQKCTKLE